MPSDKDFLRSIAIEPLDPNRHDQAAFSCRQNLVDQHFGKEAAPHSEQNFSRSYVGVKKGSAKILGFYTICSTVIKNRAFAGAVGAGKMVAGPEEIPGFYLGFLGVSEGVRRCGLGTLLTLDALVRSKEASRIVGGAFLILTPLHTDSTALFQRLGFRFSVRHSEQLFIRL